MNARILNTIGLFFGIIGVCILFVYGPPQPSFDPNQHLLTEAGPDVKILKNQATYDFRSKVGIVLVGFSFLFQLAAVWVDKFIRENGTTNHSDRNDNDGTDKPKCIIGPNS